ncbi:Sb-PDE family phosphodiesterase [Reichenbachiella sp. MALMAid0571]|uniref:Sb-PDE family phosphodiesterase n=1 Tax=Reichenbachiella sp. MALMAid0571 TaxID=3143939 RepID=UPI0032DE5E70
MNYLKVKIKSGIEEWPIVCTKCYVRIKYYFHISKYVFIICILSIEFIIIESEYLKPQIYHQYNDHNEENIHTFISTVTFFLSAQTPHGHVHSHSHGRKITFPDVPGYKVLKCDFHQHSVFSDGSVWPDIRVEEAVRDGLDVISLTEHLEYQPHKPDIPHPDRNRSYQLALNSAKNQNLIVVRGSEVTRSMPPGHINAIFIKDANKLLDDDPVKVFREAKEQGAFIFWNHPNWTSQVKDGIAKLTDMHRQLIREGLLHGIEVVNDLNYSEEALQIAFDNSLAVIGSSDIHGLIDWQFDVPEGGHRPVTLVFTKERTEDGVKDGLMNERTVAWFNNTLIGKNEFLVPLIESSIVVKEVAYSGDTKVAHITIENISDAEYVLENLSDYTLHQHADIINLKPNAATVLEVKTIEILDSFSMKFKVLNAVDAPKSHPEINLQFRVK